MNAQTMLPAAEWAAEQFEAVELGDRRRTRRTVRLAAQVAAHPAGSLPQQTGRWNETKAGYRLFDQSDVTLEALQAPHRRATRRAAADRGRVLMIQDTTEIDFTRHRAADGLGPIGNGRGRGMLLHSTLALDSEGAGELLGLANQELFCRRPRPKGESRAQRQKRARESQVWSRSVRAVGAGADAARSSAARADWIHVCDRGADNYEFYQACRETSVDFLVRAAQDRRAALQHGAASPSGLLLQLARSLEAAGAKPLTVRRRPQREPRAVQLSVSFSAVRIFPPWLQRGSPAALDAWVVRVWEPSPPADETPIEWVLLTSVPVADVSAALRIADWYSRRWLIEEYHKCLKTGCSVEQRQLQSADRLDACIGLLAIVAVRLLQLKLSAKSDPDRAALDAAPREHVRLLAAYRGTSAGDCTVYQFWREVAKLGGFLARKSDGEPGWQTLWRGWQKLDIMTLGAKLVRAESEKCG